jgi:hypothetical protein
MIIVIHMYEEQTYDFISYIIGIRSFFDECQK